MRILLTAIFFLTAAVNAALAQNPPNAIVAENLNPGTPQSVWDDGGPGSTTLLGFTTDISVNHGSTVYFKIQSGTNNWKIDIYRLGYYQGNGARLITTINMNHAQSQPAPITDATTGLVDAGNWSVTASWAVPATAVSGVYLAHLVDLNNTSNENQIPFIVRADESTSDILFQTSDMTWHAYNGWGGANLYGGNGPGGDSSPGRAYKVSYNRPFGTRDSIGTYAGWQDFLFGAEFAAIFWLEQNGYDVSYIAGVDVARNPNLLHQHKIFTSTGHDEYWDTTARANIVAARGAGLNLVFMSGNEVYWKTRWEPSIDGSNTPYRTLVCYKETRYNAPLDPLDASPTWTWTGTWRDPRFSPPADGGKPENSLTGTIFQVDSWRSDAIQVPYPMSTLRFWRNTPDVSKLTSGQTWTLTQNYLGYEWDASPDNGFAPAGLIDLSSTTLAVNTYLLDYGSTVGNDTATHNLTLYRDPTIGALVFGAGTVFWSWGLSAEHDGPPTPTDPDVQQAMVNLFADMGVQPETLQSGLVAASKSTDTTPPTSSISTPANGAGFVEGQPVVISGVASDAGGQVAGVQVSVDGGSTWFRASGTTNWTYTWNAAAGSHTIQSRATDDSLNTETPRPGISINVAAGSNLFGTTAVPDSQTASDLNSVELGVKFSSSSSGTVTGMRFWKDSINTGTHTASMWSSTGQLLASTTFTNETASGWQEVLFPQPVQITAGTTYVVSYHTDLDYSASDGYFGTSQSNSPLTAPVNAGVYAYNSSPVFPSNTYMSDNYWIDVLFAAQSGPVPPAITSPSAASGSVGAAFSYQITATNNPTSFNATGLPGGLSVNTTTGLISGTPTAAGNFNVTISATNSAGTGSATLALSIVTSGSTASLFSPSTTPSIVTVSDPSAVTLGVKFQASTNGKITAIRFYKGPQNTGTHIGAVWSTSGTLLASATFSNETASGWQQVNLPSPVNVTANTTYIVSYHTNVGEYSANGNYFGGAYTNGPLTAPASSSSGGNGVYAYGSSNLFPNNTYNANNYWVDIVFTVQ
ncbi:MAG TPA: DUF4082 domain-containing protein [Stellaceae bacterium]|nr:DUF4082 domain-containing protein [Stellaceae bacterium]